jgi:hypothetical protein
MVAGEAAPAASIRASYRWRAFRPDARASENVRPVGKRDEGIQERDKILLGLGESASPSVSIAVHA